MAGASLPLRRAPPRFAKLPKPPLPYAASPNARRSRRLIQLSTHPNYVLSGDEDNSDNPNDGDAEDSDDDVVSIGASEHANDDDVFGAANSSTSAVRRSKRKRGPDDDGPATPASKRRTPGSARINTRASNQATPSRSHRHGRKSHSKAVTPSRRPHSRGNSKLHIVDSISNDPNAVIPPWETLPYSILVQIMYHASSPLADTASVRWLLSASLTCRAFAEPAITALYRCPPLLKPSMAHNLTALLARPRGSMMFNYHQKIENITIDVGVLDSHVHQGRHIDFETLVSNCPRLTEVDICHYKDSSPYRQLDDNIKWTYPKGLFAGLESRISDSDGRIEKLKDWRWSSRMMGDMKLSDITAHHLSPTFSCLQKVTFVNFQRPALTAKDPDDPDAIAKDKDYAESLAAALSCLPRLKHVVIESSTAANEILLPLLPKTIEHLELINCWDVTAEHFTEYLLTHGRGLRSLTIDHCQSLSLSFLPVLSDACPNLRALRMDLTYFSHHEFYNDSKPMYEKLLGVNQIPTWPSSLQVIELEHLRHWDVQAAENLFQSLVGNAANLPALRRLVLKAMLDIPWRQRSQVRDKWVADFTQVFQRQCEDPLPYYTLRQSEAAIAPAVEPKQKPRASNNTPSRRSHRIAENISNPSSRASSIARGLRKTDTGRVCYTEPDSDIDLDADDETEEQDEEKQKDEEGDITDSVADDPLSPTSDTGPAIQGLCDVVDVRFDNQKPMETQYKMDDFLDSDDENSDEEWSGHDIEEGAGYAW